MMAAADRHGLGEALRAELAESQPMLLSHLQRSIPIMQPKAYRWVAEMLEIATFQADDPAAATIYDGLSAFYEGIAAQRAAAAASKNGA